MSQARASFRHVSYLWDPATAPTDEIDLLIYRSNLLGADLRITNYAGGNTSCKLDSVDPVSGEEVRVLWVKGSGGDLGTLTKNGLAALNNDCVVGLERTYRGVQFEDEQVAFLAGCLMEPRLVAPSIDTPLHAVIPHRHVDHVHPDALISFATAEGGRRFVDELFGNEIGWLDWQRPGYDLAVRLQKLVTENTGLRGVVLGGHGLITWADTALECYDLTVSVIERAASWIDAPALEAGVEPFGQRVVRDLGPDQRLAQAGALMPIIRGLGPSGKPRIAHFRHDQPVLDFPASDAPSSLSAQRTSFPHHFL